jgi:glycosyltransferase involved in cell wall biosynthesis/predicted O-methyltransferase YrrM
MVINSMRDIEVRERPASALAHSKIKQRTVPSAPPLKPTPAKPSTPRGKTIGLCMIVKDESMVILRCLESARPIIDYVLIEDTGSTDGTQAIIREWLDQTGIPGAVYDEQWHDFAHNRSHALARLRKNAAIDYALTLDADDYVVFDAGFDVARFKNNLSADVYDVELRNQVTFRRGLICSNRRPFRYRGVLHEFLERPADASTSGEAKGFHVASTREGSRGQNARKYHKDAEILKKALATEQDPLLRSRYTFYLAQSYENAGENQQALEAYLKRAELGHWSEEIFVSLYRAGNLQHTLGQPLDQAVATYLRATDAAPSRAEALHAASRLYREKEKFTEAYQYAHRGLKIPLPADGLFVEPWIYEYGLLDELSLSAYWIGHYGESLEACERLLREGKLPAEQRERIEKNACFAREKASAGIKDDGPGTLPEALAKVARQSTPPKISLVICSRDRAAQLAATLSKLDLGDLARNAVELILVDSASSDSTREVMREFKEQSSLKVSIGEADRPGLGLARNIGINISSGDVIVFTDDDCYLDANYFTSLSTLWDGQSFQYGGGQILLYDKSLDPRVANLSIEHREDIPPHSVLGTGTIQGANMFFGRAVFQKAGPFNENMGAGTPFACEDIEMATRASMRGFRGIRFPELKVQHDHGRKRGTPEANRTVEAYDFGRGAYYAALTVAGYRQASELPALLKPPHETAGANQYLEFASAKNDPKQFEVGQRVDLGNQALNSESAAAEDSFSSYAVRHVREIYPELSAKHIQRCLAYSTYVNLDRKYLYCEVPKAACTSMKLLIHSLEELPPFTPFAGDQPEVRREMFVHERSEFKLPSLLDLDDETQRFILSSPEFFRFTIVRNPYTRLQSAWKDKVLTCAPGFEYLYYQIKGGLPQGNDPGSHITFPEFVATISREDLAICNPHWRSQVEHLFFRALNFNFVGRLESLHEAIATFLERAGFAPTQIAEAANQSQANGEYDQELAEKVYALYERDFVDLGYERDSWKSNTPSPRTRTVSEGRFIDEITERNIIIGNLYSERANLRQRLRQVDEQKSDDKLEIPRTGGFDELFDRYVSRIDGWLAKEEAAYLYGLAKDAREGCIVEVGSYRGRSTASLAFGVDAGAGLPVYAVEPHEQFCGLFGGEFGPADRGSFMQTMLETGLYRHVRLLNVSGEFLSEKWPMPVSVLFIDGDHRYEAVKRDFERWRGKLAAGAVVVLDDALDPSSGPGRLAEELVAIGQFVRAPAIGKMGCLIHSAGSSNSTRAQTAGRHVEARTAKYAIITPYYKESRGVLERCIKSVRDQTAAADHILVADGFPQDWIDGSGVRHIRLDRCHDDYGDTPRGLGAIIAASEGYEGIGFLDADCWLEPDHVQYCLELASQADPQGCDYVVALRHERRPDGSIMDIRQVPPEQHVDTSCFFFLKTAFHVLPIWSLIPREVSIVGDRVFYRAVKENSLRSVIATRKTVNYTCMWASIYQAMGERPPADAKPNPDHQKVERWINELSVDDRAIINRSIQTKLEVLYPL